MKRQIIKIDQDLCTGCGVCVPNCPEGALQIIDGKARLVSDLFCDGLGACIGECPEGAIITEMREAEPYNEKIVMKNIVKQGENTILAHLNHLKNHNETALYNQAIEYLQENNIVNPLENKKSPDFKGCNYKSLNNQPDNKFSGCPSAQTIDFGDLEANNSVQIKEEKEKAEKNNDKINHKPSFLRNWPVQLNLAPLQASYYNGADLLIAADCTSASYANFHRQFVKGRTLLIGCPKLDNGQHYIEKLSQIFKLNEINSIHTLIMEVPCCNGLSYIIDKALESSGKSGIIPVTKNILSIDGYIKT